MTELNLDNLKVRAFKGVFTLTFRRLILKIIDTVGLIFLARALAADAFGVCVHRGACGVPGCRDRRDAGAVLCVSALSRFDYERA